MPLRVRRRRRERVEGDGVDDLKPLRSEFNAAVPSTDDDDDVSRVAELQHAQQPPARRGFPIVIEILPKRRPMLDAIGENIMRRLTELSTLGEYFQRRVDVVHRRGVSTYVRLKYRLLFNDWLMARQTTTDVSGCRIAVAAVITARATRVLYVQYVERRLSRPPA